MPSSHFEWSPVHSRPIFNVFGQKRKADADDIATPVPEQETFAAKRRCIMEPQPPVPPTEAPMDSMELNHNDVSHPNQHIENAGQWQQQQQRVPSPWPMEQLPHQVQGSQVEQLQQPSSGGIMELSDETFNMEAAHSTMQSDFVPDNQQYAQDASFCRDYCGQGDQSPNSGRVRCYCKPSWEGMFDTSPYISDVY